MNKTLSFFCLIILISACGRPDAVNTREEINESVEGVPLLGPDKADSSLYGVYRGVLARGNEEIQSRLSLYEDDSFLLQQRCNPSSKSNCEFKGKFKYDKESHSIRFKVDGIAYRFAIGEDLLHLTDQKGKRMQSPVHKTPFLVKSELKFDNTVWHLEQIGDIVLNDKLKYATYLRFLPDESLVYNIHCNECKGSWHQIMEGRIVFKGEKCTKKLCEPDHESAFNAVMKKVRYYKIKGNRLYLSDSSGVLAVLSTPF